MSLARWLYWRFGDKRVTWQSLEKEEQDFWEHEAKAVQRAVVRGGFKQKE